MKLFRNRHNFAHYCVSISDVTKLGNLSETIWYFFEIEQNHGIIILYPWAQYAHWQIFYTIFSVRKRMKYR